MRRIQIIIGKISNFFKFPEAGKVGWSFILNKKDKLRKKNISLKKMRDKGINNLINNYNKKSFKNLNKERGNIIFNDLLGFRKFIFNNRKLPKLKLIKTKISKNPIYKYNDYFF